MGDGRRLATPATVIAAAALALAGCSLGGNTGGERPSPRQIVAGGNHLAVTIGAPHSAEGRLLAELYAQALKAAGYRTHVIPSLRGADAWPASVRGPVAGANFRLARRGLQALPAARAELGLGVAMTRRGAAGLGVATLSELAPSAGRIRLGVPWGCSRDPACLPPLRRAYGLRRVLEVRPDLVQDTLRGGQADAALVPHDDPHLARDDERLLDDDRHALPARPVTLVVTSRAARAAGPGLATAAAKAGAALTDSALAELVARVVFDELPAARVAREFLRAAGLLRAGAPTG
jgi:osmoprotectant transport system substrate-binding protein